MKNAVKRSLVANAIVLGAVVGGSRLLGVPAEELKAVFWFQLVVQMLINELWLYSSALPVLIVTFFHRKETSQERSALRAMKLISPVLVLVPALLYTVLYLLNPWIGEWVYAELGVPLCGALLLASLLGQGLLFVLALLLSLVPVCPSALFHALDDKLS